MWGIWCGPEWYDIVVVVFGGGGMVVVLVTVVVVVLVVVEVCITVDQLHDRFLCSSLPKTLNLRLCSDLLERWTAGMHHIVVLLNTDILFHHLSLLITFFRAFSWYLSISSNSFLSQIKES